MAETNPRSLGELSLAWLNAQAGLKQGRGVDPHQNDEYSSLRITDFKAESVSYTHLTLPTKA